MKPVNIWKEQVFILEPSGDEFMKVYVEEGTRQQFFYTFKQIKCFCIFRHNIHFFKIKLLFKKFHGEFVFIKNSFQP